MIRTTQAELDSVDSAYLRELRATLLEVDLCREFLKRYVRRGTRFRHFTWLGSDARKEFKMYIPHGAMEAALVLEKLATQSFEVRGVGAYLTPRTRGPIGNREPDVPPRHRTEWINARRFAAGMVGEDDLPPYSLRDVWSRGLIR